MTEYPPTYRGSLSLVVLDDRPHEFRYAGPDEPEEVEIRPEVLRALSPLMVERLERLVREVDCSTCEANGCDQAIGDVLYEDDDTGRPFIRWHSATLVQTRFVMDGTTEGRVIAVCEQCCPITMYAADDAVPTPAPSAATPTTGDGA